MKKSADEIRQGIKRENVFNTTPTGIVVGSEHLHVLEQMPHKNTHDTIKHEGMGTDTLIQDLFDLEHINDDGNVQKIGGKYAHIFGRTRMQENAERINNESMDKRVNPRTTWDFKHTERGISNRDAALYCALKELVNNDNPYSRQFWKKYDKAEPGEELCFSVDLANPKRLPYNKERACYAYHKDGTRKEMYWGHGVRLKNGKLEEVKTPGVRLVFEKTEQNKAHPFGLAFKTAYPDAACPSAIRTERDLTPELDEILMFDKIRNQAAKAYIRAVVMAGTDSDLSLEYHNGYQHVKADNEYGSEPVSKNDLTAMNRFVMYYRARTNITNTSIEPKAVIYENGFVQLNQDAIKYTDELSADFSRILDGIKDDLQLFEQKCAYARSVRKADKIFENIRAGRNPVSPRSCTQKVQDEPER